MIQVRTFCRLAILVALFSLQLVPQARAESPSCSQLSNVYAASVDTLKSCGYAVYPLQRVTMLADGIRQYEYSINGHLASRLVPPDNFSFTTATPEQLTRFHLPQRPQDASQLSSWTERMSRTHVVASPPFLVVAPRRGSGDTTSSVWSGYMNIASGSQQFHSTYMDYIEPQTYNACTGDAVYMWTGIGGYGQHYLGQDGTQVEQGGTQNHHVWYEVVPDTNGSVITPTPTYIGNDIQARTTYDSGGTYYEFAVTDTTTGALELDTYVTTHYYGATAEYIFERPQFLYGGGIIPLRNFGTATVKAAQADAGSGLSGLQTFTLFRLIMQSNSSSPQLAVPSGVSSGGFTDTWKQCQ